ncbi:MAG: hypothetical protein M1826_005162 [Phylliscum demangeonii]|nr:MAG: hypothetical protein M1826_005162 [Phylliscum demangeonii]
MATPAHAAKRRRIEDASRALSKPFRSPFRHGPGSEPSSPTTTIDHHYPTNPTSPTTTSTTATHIPAPLGSRLARRPLPSARPPRSESDAITLTAEENAQLQQLAKQSRVLERRLGALRSEIDTLRQAHRIESTGKDAELRALIAKWTRVSREAAERLYADGRERVNRMGGPQAYRAMQRQRQEWFEMGQEEEQRARRAENQHRDGDGDGDEDEDERANDRYAEHDGDDDDVPPAKDKNEDDDDDVFTMDMLLVSLNVDLDVIGFDRKRQHWLD